MVNHWHLDSEYNYVFIHSTKHQSFDIYLSIWNSVRDITECYVYNAQIQHSINTEISLVRRISTATVQFQNAHTVDHKYFRNGFGWIHAPKQKKKNHEIYRQFESDAPTHQCVCYIYIHQCIIHFVLHYTQSIIFLYNFETFYFYLSWLKTLAKHTYLLKWWWYKIEYDKSSWNPLLSLPRSSVMFSVDIDFFVPFAWPHWKLLVDILV